MGRVLLNEAITKIFHNGPWFDVRVLRRYGLRVRNFVDTRDSRRALSSTSPLRLGYLASLYDDTTPWKEADEEDSKGLVFTEDLKKLKRYNAQDCVETARVWQGIQEDEDWKSRRVQKLAAVYAELSEIAAEMHDTGIYVVEENRQWMAWALQQEYEEKSALFLKKVGIPAMRCTPNDLRKLIYKRHATKEIAKFNLPDPIDPAMWTTDDMDAISVAEDSLILLLLDPDCPEELRELINLYWAAQSTQKARSTFVVSDLVEHAIGADGRLRPGWNSCGTDTMRWSCSEPNVMNLEQRLRYMYGAAPGRRLYHADKSQFELRIMAEVADDDVLRKALSVDVYTEDAKDFFRLPASMSKCDCKGGCGKPTEHVKNSARKAAKMIHLGKQYAAGDKTVYGVALREDMSFKYTLCLTLCRAFERRYHRTVSYWEEEAARVKEAGYSEGRVLKGRRVYPRLPELSAVANYPIQRTAAEIVNLEMIAIRKKLKKYVPEAKLVMQLHDAFDIEAPPRHGGVVRRIYEDEMGAKQYTINGRKCTFPVDIKEGITWDEV